MTLPSVIRIFFAIDLPLPIKEQIRKYIIKLKKAAKSNAIRWVKPENLHVTLQFLPEVNSDEIADLVQKVQKEIASIGEKEIAIHLNDLQVFPNPFRPRVIVLNIHPEDALMTMSNKVGNGIKASDYALENRPFRAHLTLGRIKHAQNIDLNFLKEACIDQIIDIKVKEIVLFRSEPGEQGSIYTQLASIPLFGPLTNVASG